MANRATRRKQKNVFDTKKVPLIEDDETPNLIKIGIIVMVLIIAFYGLTMFLTSKVKPNNTANNDNNHTPVTIQYDEILAGETFKMNYDEYYVMFYDFKDSEAGLYQSIMTSFKSAHTGAKVFVVDLNKGFNKPYVADASNPNVSNIDSLKVKGPTLIKIKAGLNTLYAEGKDAIKNALQ
jgi:hypothetical protein